MALWSSAWSPCSRAEGLSPGTALSLLAGIGLLATPAVMVGLVLPKSPVALTLAAVVFFSASYFGVVFVGFLVYSVVYRRMHQTEQPAALVIYEGRL